MIDRIVRKIRPFLPIPEKPTIGFVFGSGALACVILLTVWYFIPPAALAFSKSSLIGFSIIGLCRVLLCLLLPFVFFVSRYSIPDSTVYGSNPGIGAVIHSLLVGFPAMLIFVAIHNLLARLLIVYSVSIPQPAVYVTNFDSSKEATILLLVVGAGLPILLEELVFRGLLTGILPGSLYNYKGHIWIAFLFAVYMLDPVDFLPYFLLGLLLGYIRHAFDNSLCCILARFSMVAAYFMFQSLLPLLDTSVVRTEADIDSTVLYTSLTALIMGALILFPILSQIRRISGYLRMERMDAQPREAGRIRDHIGWSYWMGILFFAGLWSLVLGI